MFHAQPTLAFIRRADGTIGDVTLMLAARRGLSREEIIGRHTLEIWPSMSAALANDAEAFARPGEVVESFEHSDESGCVWRAKRLAGDGELLCFIEDATDTLELRAVRSLMGRALTERLVPAPASPESTAVADALLGGSTMVGACVSLGIDIRRTAGIITQLARPRPSRPQ